MSSSPRRNDRLAGSSGTHVQLLKQYLEEGLRGALAALSRHAWDDDDAGLRKAIERVKRLFQLRRTLHTLAASLQVSRTRGVPLYMVSARFLREAYESLTTTQDEHLVYVTGPDDGKNMFALSRFVPFALGQASRGHANPDPSSQMDALTRLGEDGQKLLATFHSHPGRGASSTHPSGVDLGTQEQLERLGYPTIGAIFSRDGLVRFYTKDRSFQVSVSGSGCERVADNLFRIIDTAGESALTGRLA